MTKEELKQIAEIVAKNQKPMPDMSKMIDWLFKALIAILVWIGSGMSADLDTLKDDVNAIKIEKQYTTSQIDDFKEFLKEPRFTKNDFDTQILPLTNQVNRNTSELNVRGPVIDDLNARLIKLEYTVSQLVNDKD